MITFNIPFFSTPLDAMWWFFTHGGFVLFIWVLLWGGWQLWLYHLSGRAASKLEWVLLAIDVPKENEQTPMALEHLFAHLHGLWKGASKLDSYWKGWLQNQVTIELVSIGGYIQFLIRCTTDARDLVESAIYAQYPNAEISEVEDYTTDIPAQFPNDTYDLWGAEIVQTGPEALPIKTYPLWESRMTETFLDPMASILEMMARLQAGEQIWFQLVLTPTHDDGWRKKGLALINKLAGIKEKESPSLFNKIIAVPGSVVSGTVETLTASLGEWAAASPPEKKKDEPYSLMQHLPTNVKNQIDAIAYKIDKLGFEVKFRFLYIGEKSVFTKSRVASVFGALKQFASNGGNGFKPDSYMKTARVYFFPKWRENRLKEKLLIGYRNRSSWRGMSKFILNTEELATLWHFPVLTVKAPQVKKTEAKRGEPPSLLPIGTMDERPVSPPPTAAGAPPTNLPLG